MNEAIGFIEAVQPLIADMQKASEVLKTRRAIFCTLVRNGVDHQVALIRAKELTEELLSP
jgi:hypothetical protein